MDEKGSDRVAMLLLSIRYDAALQYAKKAHDLRQHGNQLFALQCGLELGGARADLARFVARRPDDDSEPGTRQRASELFEIVQSQCFLIVACGALHTHQHQQHDTSAVD